MGETDPSDIRRAEIMAALFGDEIELRRDFALIGSARAPEVFRMVLRHLRHANAGAPALEMIWGIPDGSGRPFQFRL